MTSRRIRSLAQALTAVALAGCSASPLAPSGSPAAGVDAAGGLSLLAAAPDSPAPSAGFTTQSSHEGWRSDSDGRRSDSEGWRSGHDEDDQDDGCQLAHVLVVFDRVEACRAGASDAQADDGEADDSWRSVSMPQGQQLDLLHCADTPISRVQLPNGTYDGLRLHVVQACAVDEQGHQLPVEVPGGELEVRAAFSVTDGCQTVLHLDFHGRHALRVHDGCGRLRPTALTCWATQQPVPGWHPTPGPSWCPTPMPTSTSAPTWQPTPSPTCTPTPTWHPTPSPSCTPTPEPTSTHTPLPAPTPWH